jgi:hypothetical protein
MGNACFKKKDNVVAVKKKPKMVRRDTGFQLSTGEFVVPEVIVPPIEEKERGALVDFKTSMELSGWKNQDGWEALALAEVMAMDLCLRFFCTDMFACNRIYSG